MAPKFDPGKMSFPFLGPGFLAATYIRYFGVKVRRTPNEVAKANSSLTIFANDMVEL